MKGRKLAFSLGLGIMVLGFLRYFKEFPNLLILSASVAAFMYSLNELIEQGNQDSFNKVWVGKIATIIYYGVFPIAVLVFFYFYKANPPYDDSIIATWVDFTSLMALGCSIITLSWRK